METETALLKRLNEVGVETDIEGLLSVVHRNKAILDSTCQIIQQPCLRAMKRLKKIHNRLEKHVSKSQL